MLHKANTIPETNVSADSKGPQPPVIRPEFTAQPPAANVAKGKYKHKTK